MQRLTLVRYKAKPGHVEENETLSRAVFDELRAKTPGDMAYALFRDGSDFVHVFINAEADDSSPVTELLSFKTFMKGIDARCEAPPEATRFGFRLLDSYGFGFSTAPA